MADLVVASNRGPLSFRMEDGAPVRAGTAGGLAGTLSRLLTGSGATWVASAMGEADRRAAAAGMMELEGLHIVTLEPDDDVFRMAYDVVANATLWFCHHHLFDLPRRPKLDRHWRTAWDAYRTYNRLFADTIAEVAGPGAPVLVQDYHLSLVGKMLAADRPDLRTVHFSHTPFADPNMLRCLPEGVAGELLAGMAGFGACGFHTARWEAAFRAAYDDPLLAAHAGTAPAPATFVSPLGPSPDVLGEQAASDAVAAARGKLERQVGDRQLIVRVDRIELSKNILRGLWAFDELLDTHPEWRGKTTMLALAYPSRQALAEYLAYRSEVEHTAQRINEAWGDEQWTPVVLDVADDVDRSTAALTCYDVLLVNPVRDGLNLVAKEGPLVNTTDGVLVLSREAGAWEELSEGAVPVNPFDVAGTADALAQALAMSAEERSRRAKVLRSTILQQTAADWLERQVEVATAVVPAAG